MCVCPHEGRMIGTFRGVCALLWIFSLGECKISEFQVTCVISEDCVLPCTFTPTRNVLVRWYKQEVLVHSFLPSEGQQGADGKVSLFKDQVAHGNASLLLQHSSTADRGRYTCRVNSTVDGDGSIVIVRVEAPISDLIMSVTSERHVLCGTKGVYPDPSMQWATDPPSPASKLHSAVRKTLDHNRLYDVESTLTTWPPHVTCICTIKAKYSPQLWKATLMEGADIVDESGGSVLVPCVAPKDFTLQNFTLSWTFSPSSDPSVDPSALLTYDSRTRQTSMPSEGVELDQEQVLLGNGSLRLLSPESAENTGHYTCTFSALQTRHLVQTWVNITGPHTASITGHKEGELWVVAVVVGVLALLVIAILLCKRRARRSKQRDAVIEDTESQPMHTVKPVGASTVEGSHLTENLKDTCT
ncbi:CD276 antigen-like isoform X2 [Alosa sapidissima]|uniref:CD276 antigen-like isoform X2 n=1 Tax=Alosa sapidissima TaxID=34773 RepID=UPI001C0A1FBF|nr:CD276 antigen-like isoform X2 [Alosa sapidissima]